MKMKFDGVIVAPGMFNQNDEVRPLMLLTKEGGLRVNSIGLDALRARTQIDGLRLGVNTRYMVRDPGRGYASCGAFISGLKARGDNLIHACWLFAMATNDAYGFDVDIFWRPALLGSTAGKQPA